MRALRHGTYWYWHLDVSADRFVEQNGRTSAERITAANRPRPTLKLAAARALPREQHHIPHDKEPRRGMG